MNDSIENQPEDDVLYRTISFQHDEDIWGYPAPHLMAMQFEEPFPLTRGACSEILFHFSEERVSVTGEGLRVLWDEIVLDFPARISTGEHATKTGKYIIKKIEVLPGGVGR
jgi:hypothetical protein